MFCSVRSTEISVTLNVTSECKNKNLWYQMFSIPTFPLALLKEFSLLWICIQEFAHKRNTNLSTDLRISIFLAHYVQETRQEQGVRQKWICSYCIWNYQLLVSQLSDTSSVLNHGTLLELLFASACITLLFQWQ